MGRNRALLTDRERELLQAQTPDELENPPENFQNAQEKARSRFKNRLDELVEDVRIAADDPKLEDVLVARLLTSFRIASAFDDGHKTEILAASDIAEQTKQANTEANE
ncbi:hypothetical protein DVK00_02920 [Haloarcula sp. Atlit-47R]|uniref:hypothetical protein n=1 Tax=Haloarcula sp. Atlit-47R TaxID=2282132 RepID=UPI000EF1C809|nr:hypothetical protein [Haloarcula sp. Atlit-47R]RLM47476.1 hypothetical protein DVK00_02920 [Haloarcula sp. Atlit-47R]